MICSVCAQQLAYLLILFAQQCVCVCVCVRHTVACLHHIHQILPEFHFLQPNANMLRSTKIYLPIDQSVSEKSKQKENENKLLLFLGMVQGFSTFQVASVIVVVVAKLSAAKLTVQRANEQTMHEGTREKMESKIYMQYKV